MHSLWLAARTHGVGIGWVSILDPEALKGARRAEDWSLVAYLCLGYPVEASSRNCSVGWQARDTVCRQVLKAKRVSFKPAGRGTDRVLKDAPQSDPTGRLCRHRIRQDPNIPNPGPPAETRDQVDRLRVEVRPPGVRAATPGMILDRFRRSRGDNDLRSFRNMSEAASTPWVYESRGQSRRPVLPCRFDLQGARCRRYGCQLAPCRQHAAFRSPAHRVRIAVALAVSTRRASRDGRRSAGSRLVRDPRSPREGNGHGSSPPSRIGTAGNARISRGSASIRARFPALSCMVVGMSPVSMQQTGSPLKSGPPRSKSQCATSGYRPGSRHGWRRQPRQNRCCPCRDRCCRDRLRRSPRGMWPSAAIRKAEKGRRAVILDGPMMVWPKFRC